MAVTYNKRYRQKNREMVRGLFRNYARKHGEWMDSLKTAACDDCGVRFPPYVLDWDHVRGEKLVNVGQLRSGWGRKGIREVVLAEIAKCDLVCANCHRIRTHNRLIRRDS